MKLTAKNIRDMPILNVTRENIRFLKYVNTRNPCWEWTGIKNKKKYGVFHIDRMPFFAHRYMYQLVYGTLKSHQFILHECDNPSCVNPKHLKIGTIKQNILDCVNRGRQHNANKTHCPKGHRYFGDNLKIKINKSGMKKGKRSRVCITCERSYYVLKHKHSPKQSRL